MKNFLIVSNFILLLLVAVLYYLYFTTNKKVVPLAKTVAQSTIHTRNKVAYIDLDSLQSNYEYYKKIKGEYERKQIASNDEIANMQKRYQNRAMQLQQKGPTMNQQEQESAMKEINQMQQDLQTKKQSLDNELFNYNSKMKEDILNRIQNFLKEYNKDGKYDYIFSYEPGFMFYKDTSLNITNDVITGLNALYSKNKN